MANAKKLVRGLKDISAFFLTPDGKLQISPEMKLPLVEKTSEAAEANPVSATFSSAAHMEEPVEPEGCCLSILPVRSYERFMNSKSFMDELGKVFPEKYALTFAYGQAPEFSSGEMKKVFIPPFQLEDILHPEPAPFEMNESAFGRTGNVCFFIDPQNLFGARTDLFLLLDHVILCVSARSSETLLNGYQFFNTCLQRNPKLHFSLLVEDVQDDDMCITIYERFSAIASQFLACEIDFLGWVAPGGRFWINPEILLHPAHLLEHHRNPIKNELMRSISQELVLEA